MARRVFIGGPKTKSLKKKPHLAISKVEIKLYDLKLKLAIYLPNFMFIELNS